MGVIIAIVIIFIIIIFSASNDTTSQGVEISEEEKLNTPSRNSKVFQWGCLAPFALIVLLAIAMFGGDHPSDAGAVVGMLLTGVFITTVVLPILVIVWLIWFIVVYWYSKK